MNGYFLCQTSKEFINYILLLCVKKMVLWKFFFSFFGVA